MSLATEEKRIRSLFGRVEAVEGVAETMEEGDDRRVTLLVSARGVLTEIEPVRPRIAALLLGLSERTVRAWVEEGVLVESNIPSRRLLLDPERIHDVMHLVRDLREAGRSSNLLEAVWHHLTDRALMDREDLSESLAQMRRGEGRVLHPEPGAEATAP